MKNKIEIFKEKLNQQLSEGELTKVPQELREAFYSYAEKTMNKNANEEELRKNIIEYAHIYISDKNSNDSSSQPIPEYSTFWVQKFREETLNKQEPEEKRNDFALDLVTKLNEFEHLDEEYTKYIVGNMIRKKNQNAENADLGMYFGDLIVACYAVKEENKLKDKCSEEEFLKYKQEIERLKDFNNPVNKCSLENLDFIHERVDNFLGGLQEYRANLKTKHPKGVKTGDEVIRLNKKRYIFKEIKNDLLNFINHRWDLPDDESAKPKSILKKNNGQGKSR